ncbi:MAG: CopG family transcriptional regulator [Gammaproteobacteria bacterium]|nr:CopG family transcriptional regulator [Gammaproteobacteria bacterium]MYE86758.1 CopG family transcriptional regulator [Gammaproteobacteria bacterium]
MKAKEFERQFDAGEDIMRALDLPKARRLRQQPKRVNVDFPVWMVEELDKEAKRLATTRQAIIKIWLSERLDQITAKAVR